MNWFWIVLGVALVFIANIRGAYHKNRMPRWYVQFSLIAAGLLLRVGGGYMAWGL
jgi:hypothetical protein